MKTNSVEFDMLIEDLPNYAFSGNDLYALTHFSGKRTKYQRRLKLQTMNKGKRETKGYFVEGKFRSLTSLMRRAYPKTMVILDKSEVDKKYF